LPFNRAASGSTIPSIRTFPRGAKELSRAISELRDLNLTKGDGDNIKGLATLWRFEKALSEIPPVLSFDPEALDRPFPKGGVSLKAGFGKGIESSFCFSPL
jgi:hypothetical protein